MEKTTDNTDVFDTLETLIIMAMDINKKSNPDIILGTTKSRKEIIDYINVDALFKIDDMEPTSSYTTDLTNERLYTMNPQELLNHPAEIFGALNGGILFADDFIKWVGVRELKRFPSHLYTIGKVSHCYEFHFRMLQLNGKEFYGKRIVPFTAKGSAMPVRHKGDWITNAKDGNTLILLASLIEDSQRKDCMLATVSDATEIKFPVPLNDYKELFIIRDGPLTPTGKKKAIIHWVAKHIRRTKKTVTTVKKHVRGVKNINIDGMNISITPN